MAAAKRSKGTVGVIGLGIMGGAFAKNLAAAGWRVVGYDISAARRREAERAGVEIARSAADVAAKVPTVLTSLPKPQALMDTVRAIAAAKLKRVVIVEMSTFAIADKEKAERVAAKAGHVMLDCPVSGTGSQARARDLVFYASGNSAAIKRLRPMFEAFGRHVYDVGAFGNGSKMKYVANLLVAINNVASAEAMVLGMKAGPAAAAHLRSGESRRRQFARVRTARADDGEGQLQRRHHEDRRVGQGHAGDRRLRPQDQGADADVRRHQADLHQGDEERLRRAGHRRGLRRAGEDGQGQARQAQVSDRPLIPVRYRGARPLCRASTSL